MTIDEAIKKMEGKVELAEARGDFKTFAAERLGIEALNRVKAERTGYETYAPDLLPGETEE